MRVLRARLLEREIAEQQAKIASERRAQVGTGERSEKIRTYNFPRTGSPTTASSSPGAGWTGSSAASSTSSPTRSPPRRAASRCRPPRPDPRIATAADPYHSRSPPPPSPTPLGPRPTRSPLPAPRLPGSTRSCCSARRPDGTEPRSRPKRSCGFPWGHPGFLGDGAPPVFDASRSRTSSGGRASAGSKLLVDRRVLIPRPETELLVEVALELAPEAVIDVGTGSGAIALAIADELPDVRVTGIDTSLDALRVARPTATASAWPIASTSSRVE